MNPFLEKASICQWDNWAGLAEWFWWYGRQPKPPNCRLEEKMARSAISRQLSATTPFYLDQATFHIAGERQLNEWNQLLSSSEVHMLNIIFQQDEINLCRSLWPMASMFSTGILCIFFLASLCRSIPFLAPATSSAKSLWFRSSLGNDNHNPTMYRKH